MGTRFDSETRPDRTAPKDTVTALEPRTESSAAAPSDTPRDRSVHYVALTKPRIIELLLVTTFPTMFLAQRGVPSLWLVVATLVGGTLSAASANTLNCYLDRDIDKMMHRTENRPLVTGAISPRGRPAVRCRARRAVLALAGAAGQLAVRRPVAGRHRPYVGFYTMLLKRRTSQNIVWGGVAGCMPVLIGWSAVTNSLSWAALVLFLIIFFWTPPHYWPLSMRFKDEYEAAGVPMLPVVAKDSPSRARSSATAGRSSPRRWLLVPVAGMGWVYLVVAVVSGAVFLLEAYRLLARAKAPENHTTASLKPMRLFHFSISYLTLLFLAVAIDPLLHLPL